MDIFKGKPSNHFVSEPEIGAGKFGLSPGNSKKNANVFFKKTLTSLFKKH